MANDNILSPALGIVANPSNAVAAINEFRPQAKMATADIQCTIAEEAAQIYKQMGINGQEAAREIAAAYGQVGSAAEAMGEQMRTAFLRWRAS
jgi:hypothetical protein